MMDNFSQILQKLPMGSASTSYNHSGGAGPFKVQVNLNIPIFEGQRDADIVYRWLNLQEGYFLVHDFSNEENINFSLFKVVLHFKGWWETYCEKKDEREPSLFLVAPTWNSFRDDIKEQYNPLGSYDEKYIQYTMLRKQRDQDVHEVMKFFHTLCTNLGFKYSERNLVLKYYNYLHKHIQDEIEFLDITSLGMACHHAAKIEHKFKQKKRDF